MRDFFFIEGRFVWKIKFLQELSVLPHLFISTSWGEGGSCLWSYSCWTQDDMGEVRVVKLLFCDLIWLCYLSLAPLQPNMLRLKSCFVDCHLLQCEFDPWREGCLSTGLFTTQSCLLCKGDAWVGRCYRKGNKSVVRLRLLDLQIASETVVIWGWS